MKLFGFDIKRKKDNRSSLTALAPSQKDDGALTIFNGAGFGFAGYYLSLDPSSSLTDSQLINRYREMLLQPEVDAAVDDIVNETVVYSETEPVVTLNTEKVTVISKNLAKKVREEFDEVVRLLNFKTDCYEITKRFYVDGRLFYQKVIDKNHPKDGIQEAVPLDPRKIRKVREVKKRKEQDTGVEVIDEIEEYYIYSEQFNPTDQQTTHQPADNNQVGSFKITPDSICYVHSGIYDSSRNIVLSHLHKAIKSLNQLKIMEDSLVIYRITRAPERRIFYIDVGSLPKNRAEEYVQNLIAKYKNKTVYNATTGEVSDTRNHMHMLEDFWLPRREGGKGTEVTTLQGGQHLDQITDIEYFQKKLYKSLNVPISRLESDKTFSFGRTGEITRDELKFQKFITRFRHRLSDLFNQMLGTQLILKQVITEEEWEDLKEEIFYDFRQDTMFAELKDLEVLTGRLTILSSADQYVGKYFSSQWIRTNILQQTEEEVEEIKKQIAEDKVDDPALAQSSMSAGMGGFGGGFGGAPGMGMDAGLGMPGTGLPGEAGAAENPFGQPAEKPNPFEKKDDKKKEKKE